jgi:hypothetical protein
MTIVNTTERVWLSLSLKPAISSTTEVDVLNSAIKESVPKDWLPAIFMGYEASRGVGNTRAFDSSDQTVNGWLSLLREELYSNPSVEDIFVTIEDNNVDAWVVIPHRDLGVLHQIVEKEWELLKILVSGKSPAFLIDFHIIYRYGRNVQDLAPTRAIPLPR